jgi:hypothetical protein
MIKIKECRYTEIGAKQVIFTREVPEDQIREIIRKELLKRSIIGDIE